MGEDHRGYGNDAHQPAILERGLVRQSSDRQHDASGSLFETAALSMTGRTRNFMIAALPSRQAPGRRPVCDGVR